jgi:MFS family permease
MVPRDRTVVKKMADGSREKTVLEPFKMSYQFLLAIFLFFMVFGLNQLLRFITPAALRAIEGQHDVAGHVGIVFSLAGLVSAISVLFLGPAFFKLGHLRPALVIASGIGAVGMVALAIAGSTWAYLAGFLVIAAMLSAMTPATNTLIAANVTRSRRGTAFGVAGSAQALSNITGPAGAAAFAAISLSAGFALLGAMLAGVGALLMTTMREPRSLSMEEPVVEDEPVVVVATAPSKA